MWNLKDWEVFERWANNQSEKLRMAWANEQKAQQELQRMKAERTEMLAKIDSLERTFSSVHQDWWFRGWCAIERLVCDATGSADKQNLPPVRCDERVMDRLDVLVERMARDTVERRMEAPEEQRGDESDDSFDPNTSMLANKAMHDVLHYR